MKGLVLSGGRGTRLRPITFTSAKQLLPIANKPVLFYCLALLVANPLRGGVPPIVEEFRTKPTNCQILLTRVKDPSRFGVVELRDGKVARLVEKPREFV